MKESIDKAPEAYRRNFYLRLYGNASMGEGYADAADYAKSCHYMPPPPVAVYGLIAERIKATGDMQALRTFCVTHANELRAEAEADRIYRSLAGDWRNGPSAAEVIAKNQAAYQADKLEMEIRQRTNEILGEREGAERARAFAQARKELSR